jgi:hypothetical protein
MKKTILALIIGCGFFLVASTAEAGCGIIQRRSVVTFPTTLQYPTTEVIVQDANYIAVPVLIPAFSFQYSQPCVMPTVAAAPVVPAPQAAPMPAAHSDESVRQLAKALLEEMSKQANPNEDDGPPVVRNGSFGSPAPAPVTGLSVLANRCASCHTGATSKAGLVIFSSPGVFNVAADRQRIVKAIDEGRMPLDVSTKRAYVLPVEEKNAVRRDLIGK